MRQSKAFSQLGGDRSRKLIMTQRQMSYVIKFAQKRRDRADEIIVVQNDSPDIRQKTKAGGDCACKHVV